MQQRDHARHHNDTAAEAGENRDTNRSDQRHQQAVLDQRSTLFTTQHGNQHVLHNNNSLENKETPIGRVSKRKNSPFASDMECR